MKQLKEFTIPFVGLKLGKHQFDYKIGQSFFEVLEYDEFNDASIDVTLDFNKKTTMFELLFSIEGTINVNCDVTNEPFDLPIANSINLVVKFGSEYNDENEELLIIPHGEYEINVQQYVYEAIVLAVPSKRVHPGVEDGTLESEMYEKLEELSPDSKSKQEEVDPRWNKLKELLKDK